MEPGSPAPAEPGDGGASSGGPLLHSGGVLPHQGGREEDLHQQVCGGHQEGERWAGAIPQLYSLSRSQMLTLRGLRVRLSAVTVIVASFSSLFCSTAPM